MKYHRNFENVSVPKVALMYHLTLCSSSFFVKESQSSVLTPRHYRKIDKKRRRYKNKDGSLNWGLFANL